MKGYIEPRGEKTYRIHVHLGYDESGKRLRKVVTVKGTRKDAEKKLAELLNEAYKGTVVANSPHTVRTFLELWLQNYVRHRSARTLANYHDYCRYYLIPYLGHIRLDQLKPSDIQACYTCLEQMGGRRNGRPLSARMVFNAHRVFKGALKRAVVWQMLAKNPADAVTPPSPKERPPRVLTDEQIALVLEQAGPQLYLPLVLACCTGFRRGEVCGLRWQDVNFTRNLIAVRQTLVRVSSSNLQFKEPQTEAAKRTVSMPQLLVEALQTAKEKQEQIRQQLGPSYNPDGLVVCREDGTHVDPVTLYKRFQKLLERLGLPSVSLHDLRHSHATLLLEAGINPKVVSERLGHTDPAFTLRVYSHVLEPMQQEAAAKTDEKLRQALQKRIETQEAEGTK